MGAGEQLSGRPGGCGSTGFSLGCLRECVWGWACPRDIPELFWEAAILAGLADHPDMLVFLMRQSVSEGDVQSLHNPEGCAILSAAVESA